MQRVLVLRTNRPPMSFRVGLGSAAVLVAAVGGAIGFIAVGVGSGDFPLSPAEVLATLAGGGDDTSRFVVWTLRLPRLLTAVLVGAALGVSGAIFQTLTRNPLVAPDIIGVNGGAALAAVAVIILGLPAVLIAPAAFGGGLVAATVVSALAWRGGLSSLRFVLVGIGVSAVASAGVGYLLTRGELFEVQRATVWLIGSLYATDWGDVVLIAGTLAVLLPATLVLGRELGVMQLGDEAAVGVGVRLEQSRLVLVVIAVGLAAISVSIAGPIGFVAFIAPHLARRLATASSAGAIPASAAMGALLLIASDIVARRIVDPVELPVGIVTVLLGAPYFLWLLARAGRFGSAT